MTREQMRDMAELDRVAEEAGGFVSPMFNNNVHYDYRKLLAYCEEKGIDPRDVTIKELDKFIIPL